MENPCIHMEKKIQSLNNKKVSILIQEGLEEKDSSVLALKAITNVSEEKSRKRSIIEDAISKSKIPYLGRDWNK